MGWISTPDLESNAIIVDDENGLAVVRFIWTICNFLLGLYTHTLVLEFWTVSLCWYFYAGLTIGPNEFLMKFIDLQSEGNQWKHGFAMSFTLWKSGLLIAYYLWSFHLNRLRSIPFVAKNFEVLNVLICPGVRSDCCVVCCRTPKTLSKNCFWRLLLARVFTHVLFFSHHTPNVLFVKERDHKLSCVMLNDGNYIRAKRSQLDLQTTSGPDTTNI